MLTGPTDGTDVAAHIGGLLRGSLAEEGGKSGGSPGGGCPSCEGGKGQQQAVLAAQAATAVNPLKVISRIKESVKLTREAVAAGRSAQKSLDHLVSELSRGNLNPGIGTRPIGRGLSEARARDWGRVCISGRRQRGSRFS